MYTPRQILSQIKHGSPQKPDLSKYDPKYGPVYALDGTRISPADIDEYPGAYQPLRYRKHAPKFNYYRELPEMPDWSPEYLSSRHEEIKIMGNKPAHRRKDFMSASSSSSRPVQHEDFSMMDQYINYPPDNEDRLSQQQRDYRSPTPVSVPAPYSLAPAVAHSEQLPHSIPAPPSTPKRKHRSSSGQPSSPVSPLRRSTRVRKPPAKYMEMKSVNRV